MKKRLFTPGPTPVPENIQLSMARPILHHRNKDFEEIFAEVNSNLQYLFQTKQPVLTFASSGTGAMEAAFVSCLSRGDTILNIEGGKFGERWTKIPQAYGIEVDVLKIEWGKSATAEDVAARLKANPKIKAVVMTHSETSTGAFTDVKNLAKVVRDQSNALIMVDGVTSVGAMEVRFDDWGLDTVATGSQKGLMLPPGLGILAVSDRALKARETSDLPKFYFDIKRAAKEVAANTTPFTPAVSLIMGLQESLRMIRSEGLENVWQRHAMMAESCRRAVKAVGLEVFAEKPANSVTAVKVPSSLNADQIFKSMRGDHGMTLAGGQDHLKGKIFRISHLGYYDVFDMVTVIAGLEKTLSDLKHPFSPGSGVQAIQQFLTNQN
ncbi:MAG: alanine--glyoxylate aminotransferase family protein [Bacteroidetes bacterium]|nr:alanine--glyoxylate aminotransferase family protein [Bacteroidota bacterium]